MTLSHASSSPDKRIRRGLVSLRTAVAMELAGVALLVGSSFVPLPFPSTLRGTVDELDWNYGCCKHLVSVSALGDDYQIDYTFTFSGRLHPSSPGLKLGDVVEVTYRDVSPRREVLTFTANPGAAGSVNYATDAYATYEQRLPLAYAALLGLIIGLLLAGAGLVGLWMAGRRIGAPNGAIGTGLVFVCTIGSVPLIILFFGLPADLYLIPAATIVWLLATITGVAFSIRSRRLGEEPRSYATFGLTGSGALSAAWLLTWVIALTLVASNSY